MTLFDWIVAAFILVSASYLSFVQTAGAWILALRRGEAVNLLPGRQGRNWPLWAQISFMLLGLVLFVLLYYFLWIPLFPLPQPIKWILTIVGLILYIAGFLFVEWGRHTLGKFWGLSTSRQVKLLDDHQLIRSGPYAYVRHPMYFGAWVLFFGLVLVYPMWAVLLTFLSTLAAFLGRARREDAALGERFKDEWADYKKHTKFVIPFLY